MATFDIENNVFIKALTLNSQSSVLALSTAGKFVNRNISIQITAKNGSASTPATTIAQAPTITLTTATGSIVASYNKSQSVTPTVTAGWVSTGTAGTISTTGSASLTLPASTATVTDNSITIQPGWFGATTALTVTSGSASTPATTIAKAPTISVATATGVVTARYNSSQSITPTVVAGWVSSGTAGTVSTTGNATLTLPTAGVSLTNNEFSLTPGWIGTTTALSVQTVSMTATAASKSGTSFTQGILSVPTGYVSATTAALTSFANSASSGTTYLDISDTTGAPILASEGYLYINRGYTDNVRISLAKLIPDDANVSASDQLRSGYAAYDSAGNLITGNIPDKSSSDVTESSSNVVVPSGYYASTVTLALDAGAYSAGVTLSAVTVTPSVSITNASTYGFTTTQPSSGTYITINPGADSPSYSATATATISTAGYLSTGNKKTGRTATVGVNAGTNYYAKVVTPTFAGGGLSTSNTSSISTTAVVTVSSTGTFLTVGTANYGVTTIKPISGVDGTSYLTIDGKGTVTTNGVTNAQLVVDRAAVTYSTTAGVIKSTANEDALSATSTTVSANVIMTPTVMDNFAPLYMSIVTPTFNGGGLTTNTHTNVVTTAPNVTLSATGTLVSATAYGVTTVQPISGTYRTIDVYAVSNNGQATSDFKVTRATSNFSVPAGAIAQYDNVKTLNGASNTGTQSVTVAPTITDNFNTLYIPVVSPLVETSINFTTAIHAITATPVVTISTTGTFFTNTATYGITTTKPSGTDGAAYLTLDGKGVVSTTGYSYAEFYSTLNSIKWQQDYHGLLNATADYSIGASISNAITQTSVVITPTITDNFATHYIPIVSTTFSGGNFSVTTNTNAVTQSPIVTISSTGTFASASTYGVTTSGLSGTDGVDYLSIDATGTVTTEGFVTSGFRVEIDDIIYNNQAGLIASNSNTVAIAAKGKGGSALCRVTPGIRDDFRKYFIPIVSTTFSGGGLTVSSTNAISTNMATTSTSSYYIDAVATVTATRAQVNYNNAAGAIAAHSGATAINASNSNSSSTATRIYIPKATFSTTYSYGDPSSTTCIGVNAILAVANQFNNDISIRHTASKGSFTLDVYSENAGYSTTSTTVSHYYTGGDSISGTLYLKGVTLNKPASGEAKFSITVPNGSDDMITFVFHVDSSGNVVVDDSTDNVFS